MLVSEHIERRQLEEGRTDLKFLWHFDRQNRKHLESLRTNMVPVRSLRRSASTLVRCSAEQIRRQAFAFSSVDKVAAALPVVLQQMTHHDRDSTGKSKRSKVQSSLQVWYKIAGELLLSLEARTRLTLCGGVG